MMYIFRSKCLIRLTTRKWHAKNYSKIRASPAKILLHWWNGMLWKPTWKKSDGWILQTYPPMLCMRWTNFNKQPWAALKKQFKEKPVVLLMGWHPSKKRKFIYTWYKNNWMKGNKCCILFLKLRWTNSLPSAQTRVWETAGSLPKFSDAERVEIWNNELNDKSYEGSLAFVSSIFPSFQTIGIGNSGRRTRIELQHDLVPAFHRPHWSKFQMYGAKTLLNRHRRVIFNVELATWPRIAGQRWRMNNWNCRSIPAVHRENEWRTFPGHYWIVAPVITSKLFFQIRRAMPLRLNVLAVCRMQNRGWRPTA